MHFTLVELLPLFVFSRIFISRDFGHLADL